jgi:hypothetical protein
MHRAFFFFGIYPIAYGDRAVIHRVVMLGPKGRASRGFWFLLLEMNTKNSGSSGARGARQAFNPV